MASETRICGDGRNGLRFGFASWVDPGNVTTEDDTYASVTHTGLPVRNILADQFGFSIASDKSIQGIEVRIGAYATIADAAKVGNIWLKRVEDSADSNDRASTNTNHFGTSESELVWGGSTDLWGYSSLTPSEVNAADFGCDIVMGKDGIDEYTLYADYIKITVHYTDASGERTFAYII